MLKKGSKITTPKDEKFVKVFKNKDNKSSTTSFFYSIREKNENGTYYTKENYLINAIGVELPLNVKVVIEEIISVEPKLMTSKNGKEYLNVIIGVKVRDVQSNQETTQYNENNNQFSYSDTINSLSDYADYI